MKRRTVQRSYIIRLNVHNILSVYAYRKWFNNSIYKIPKRNNFVIKKYYSKFLNKDDVYIKPGVLRLDISHITGKEEKAESS